MAEIFIGWDSREPVAAEVAAYSIRCRTRETVNITFLKHRELRQQGYFSRDWKLTKDKGNFLDTTIEEHPETFSTEFSYTRFLVPALMNYKGWALFLDSDMIFLEDVKELFKLCDNRYAIMCVKHTHKVDETKPKMDNRSQKNYYRKNWSSFILWNCGHPANASLTIEKVNEKPGKFLHEFAWLKDEQIGALPTSYNFISGTSPPMPVDVEPSVIHYTEGGPWFENYHHVPYAQNWLDEYEHMQRNRSYISEVPSIAYDKRFV